jgi:hypothetical protein
VGYQAKTRHEHACDIRTRVTGGLQVAGVSRPPPAPLFPVASPLPAQSRSLHAVSGDTVVYAYSTWIRVEGHGFEGCFLSHDDKGFSAASGLEPRCRPARFSPRAPEKTVKRKTIIQASGPMEANHSHRKLRGPGPDDGSLPLLNLTTTRDISPNSDPTLAGICLLEYP